jgi:hypothetical protein
MMMQMTMKVFWRPYCGKMTTTATMPLVVLVNLAVVVQLNPQ